MNLPSLLVALLLAPALVFSQSQHEMNAQAQRDAEKADADLNRVYKQVVATLDAEGAKLLRESQRAWIAFRDAEAASAADEMRDGSAAPLLYSGAVTRLTRERIAHLKLRLPDAAQQHAPAPAPSEPKPKAKDKTTPKADAKTDGPPAGAKTQAQAAQLFFDAYRAHDRRAAAAVASETALKKLVWNADAGDNPTLQLMDNTHIRYEGGSISLQLKKNDSGRHYVADVVLYAD